ncbi:hypothetical protein L5515_010359 [Caenorhabditis briggsae]|uniref:Uncharacterized protein n=1 Tax=Caenorhabditis briggsae TaxID=6238 RepID=A0AAE9JD33_CAEBR|nr:hypothetical protein L5515_010359 [Caenorhabditis briggsae]
MFMEPPIENFTTFKFEMINIEAYEDEPEDLFVTNLNFKMELLIVVLMVLGALCFPYLLFELLSFVSHKIQLWMEFKRQQQSDGATGTAEL